MTVYFALDDQFRVSLASNDRGAWTKISDDSTSSPEVFQGFDGENVITIHLMTMQNLTSHVLVVHSSCDNPSAFLQAICNAGAEEHTINRLIASLLTYPEFL